MATWQALREAGYTFLHRVRVDNDGQFTLEFMGEPDWFIDADPSPLTEDLSVFLQEHGYLPRSEDVEG
jgi:hypothetical protein